MKLFIALLLLLLGIFDSNFAGIHRMKKSLFSKFSIPQLISLFLLFFSSTFSSAYGRQVNIERTFQHSLNCSVFIRVHCRRKVKYFQSEYRVCGENAHHLNLIETNDQILWTLTDIYRIFALNELNIADKYHKNEKFACFSKI